MKFRQFWSEKKPLITIGILILVGLFLGFSVIQGVKVKLNNTKLKVSGGIFYSVEVPYSDIDDVSLVKSIEFGSRNNGAAIGTYKFGYFENSSYGTYKLFANSDVKQYIVVKYDNQKTVVFNCKNMDATTQTYEKLLEQVKENSVK